MSPLAIVRAYLEKKLSRKGMSRRSYRKTVKHYNSVLNRQANAAGFSSWKSYVQS